MKTNKITTYELLGKVKDDSKTDIYVKYFNKISQKEDKMWACKENIIYKLENLIIDLNDEVEIIEEDEFEDIERLGNNFTFEDNNSELSTRDWEKSVISKKINSLIKNQKKIINELKNKD